MVLGNGAAVLTRLFDAVARPARFVAVQQTMYVRSRLDLFDQFLKLSWVYVGNLLLYAVPLTLAGIGFTSTATPPSWFATIVGGVAQDPDPLWQLTVGTVQNSVFLTAATGVVLVAYHSAVVVSLESRGFLQSVYTVVYATSAYLATIFTAVMYLSTTAGVSRARNLVIDAQKTVFYVVIDALNANVDLPGGRPDALVLSGLSPRGELVIGLLLVAAGYFLNSLYLGARVNHGVGRFKGLLIVSTVMLAPGAYVVGTIVYSVAVA